MAGGSSIEDHMLVALCHRLNQVLTNRLKHRRFLRAWCGFRQFKVRLNLGHHLRIGVATDGSLDLSKVLVDNDIGV